VIYYRVTLFLLLFILVMETLNALFRKVDVASLLQPMGVRQIKHRVSLYAYDLIIFISPVASDLSLVNGIFQAFREAWGLRCNFNKCQITPIRCDDAQISLTIEFFPCAVVEFPIRYLGIPLSTTKLLKSSWHSLIDKVADKLPVWKGNLMHKSRRLTLIKTTLSAVPIHSAISLEFPAWVLKALIKLMREFLWMGMEVVPGGRCSVTWSQVQHPLAVVGLGIPDLELMGKVLRLRWLWRQRKSQVNDGRIQLLPCSEDAATTAFFLASIRCTVGNSVATLFWSNPWLEGQSIAE
jgi:hypothetical protein